MKKFYSAGIICLLLVFVTSFMGAKQVPVRNTTRRIVVKNIRNGKKSIPPKKRNLKKGPGFKGYVLGEVLRNIFGIRRVRPFNSAHVKWDEGNCHFYSPKRRIQIGDFVIPQNGVYLIFYKQKLFRIRILNKFTSKKGRDLDFYTSMRAALTVKYGNTKSVEKKWTRYDGKYIWKKGAARIMAVFSYIEFTEVEIEKLVHKELKKGKKINSSDI